MLPITVSPYCMWPLDCGVMVLRSGNADEREHEGELWPRRYAGRGDRAGLVGMTSALPMLLASS